MMGSIFETLVAFLTRPDVQAAIAISGLLLTLAGVSWRRNWRSLSKPPPPKEGQPIPITASDLERAHLVQRNRFILQSMCLDFYSSVFGRQLISPLRPMPCPPTLEDLPLLVEPSWIPDKLVAFSALKLHWSPDTPPAKHFDIALDHRLEVELKKRKSQNRLVYRLVSVSSGGGPLELTFSPDTYVSYINTCEAMLWSAAAGSVEFLVDRGYTGFIPDREYEILCANANAILSADQYRNRIVPHMLENRCASVGINALTVLRRPGSFPIFLMHRRGEVNREASGAYHVMPAGTFQPILWNDRQHATEFDLNFTLLREFAEECYNDKADTDGHLENSIHEIRAKNRQLDATLRLYSRGAIKTFFMGLSLDAVTLKPEVLALCLADLSTLETAIGNFEDQYEGIRVQEPFDRQRLEELLGRAPQERLLSAAMGCLTLAHKHFDAILSELEDLAK